MIYKLSYIYEMLKSFSKFYVSELNIKNSIKKQRENKMQLLYYSWSEIVFITKILSQMIDCALFEGRDSSHF